MRFTAYIFILLPFLLTNCKETSKPEISPEEAQLLEIFQEIKNNTTASDEEIVHSILELQNTQEKFEEYGLVAEGESFHKRLPEQIKYMYQSSASTSADTGLFALKFIKMIEEEKYQDALKLSKGLVAVEYHSRTWLDCYPLPDEYKRFTEQVEDRIKTDQELKNIIKKLESN